MSFGWRDALTGGWWADAAREVRDFFDQVARTLGSAARVETKGVPPAIIARQRRAAAKGGKA